MRTTRIYQNIELLTDKIIVLDERATHYLQHVLRVVLGQTIKMFNGQGVECLAEIIRIEKKKMEVMVKTLDYVSRESCLHIHLAQSVSKGDHMDYAIQKSAELGVKQITPIVSDQCDIKLYPERDEKRQQHWQNIIISACEQSGRNQLPSLNQLTSFKNWVTFVSQSNQMKLIFYPSAGNSLATQTSANPKEIFLLIGPEGGLTQDEIKLAEDHGFIGIKLSDRILRTETAALVAIAACQTLWGDFR